MENKQQLHHIVHMYRLLLKTEKIISLILIFIYLNIHFFHLLDGDTSLTYCKAIRFK